MDETTVARLSALNSEFYRRHADSFDLKRHSPWPGWERVAQRLEGTERPSILDLGCGNGRFGHALAQILGLDIDYLGVDESGRLLSIARRRSPEDWSWIRGDCLSEEFWRQLAGRCFDLVGCFGVLHHVPGAVTRRTMVERLAALTAPDGLLALSFWQFGERERFARRAIDWSEFNRYDDEGVDTGEIESGDHLLAWGAVDGVEAVSTGALRYCHHVDGAEARGLVADLGLDIVDEFRADGGSGDLNLYLVLRATVGRQSRMPEGSGG